MNLKFTNDLGEYYSLGSVSFGFLDQNNIFDSYQENLDVESDVIFSCSSSEKLKALSQDIKNLIDSSEIREDIEAKILGFCAFLTRSESVAAFIE
jgi:hypothetical protein